MRGILLSTLLLFSLQTAADNWIASKEMQGVEVFSRYPEGRAYKEYQAEILVNAKPDRVVRLLQDLEQAPSWHYRTERVESLRALSMTRALIHIYIDPPWPLGRRDVLCQASPTLEPDGTIRLELESYDAPETPGYIRMPRLQARWLVSPAGARQSRVNYRIYSEPGGQVPGWFYNSVAMDVPLYSLLRLRRHLARED